MPYNLPSYDVQRISIGPAILYVGVAGQTPQTDIGAVYEADLKISAEEDKFFAGSPSGLQWKRSKHVEVTLTVKGLEWNLSTLQKTFGGLVDTTGSTETYFATGDVATAISLRAVHQTPFGGTVTIDLFRAISAGFPDISFGFAPHQFPLSFSALVSRYDYSGSALPANTMFKIVFEKAP